MLCINRCLLGQPVCLALASSVRPKLLATINLGTQLFNPFRFSTVLSTVSHELVSPTVPSEDISDLFSRYMQSAIACFKEQSNVSIIGFDQTVSVLRLLSQELQELPLANEVYDTIAKSFMECLKNSNDTEFTSALIALSRERLLDLLTIHHAVITARIEKIKSAKCRIRLVEEANVNVGDVTGFLIPVVESNMNKLMQLSEKEIAVLLSIFPRNQNLLDLLETKLGSSSKFSPNEIVEICCQIFRTGSPDSMQVARSLFVQFFANHDVELLSVHHQIDAAWIGSEQYLNVVVNNMVWRLERDGTFLSNMDTLHAIRLIEICANLGARDAGILLCGISNASLTVSTPQDLIRLFRAMSRLPGNAWIEHGELSERILNNFIQYSPAGIDEKSVFEIWESFVDSVRVTDWSVVKPIATRLTKRDVLQEKLRGVVESSNQESRLGNIAVARIVSRSSLSDEVYEKALSCLDESGSIPLNLKASSLKPVQIIELLNRAKSLGNLEWLAEASVSTTVQPTTTDKMELLRLFAQEHKFPATLLINSIASEISNLSVSQFLDFVSYSAMVRCAFSTEKLVEYMRLVDLREIEPVRVVNLIEDLSSMGMLRTEGLASRLMTSFTSNSGYKNLTSDERAELSSRLLSSLCVSLVIPSPKHLTLLCNNIKGHGIDKFDKHIIREFASVVDQAQLNELVDTWANQSEDEEVEQNLRVLPEETMFHPCEELTQLKKFKLFVRNQANSNLVSWVSHT